MESECAYYPLQPCLGHPAEVTNFKIITIGIGGISEISISKPVKASHWKGQKFSTEEALSFIYRTKIFIGAVSLFDDIGGFVNLIDPFFVAEHFICGNRTEFLVNHTIFDQRIQFTLDLPEHELIGLQVAGYTRWDEVRVCAERLGMKKDEMKTTMKRLIEELLY